MGEQFGQRRPPLSVTIKQILERYPDGQIFKEMIQNADDAGATVVQFYVDCRQHGTRGLVKHELAAYQGPALISANDAMFSQQDWEGIQSLQQSIKADDPFKVGRFGIGFNSVYHLTDVPSIISGGRMAFLEPQEKIWDGQSGRWFSLQEISGSDHLNCLHGISDFNSRGRAHYNKTIFRFPLRKAASSLSENVYSLKRVNELIDALRSEAKLLLLFLRSVHTIEVYSIDKHGNQSLSFRTKIADSFIASVNQKRAAFLSDLKSCYSSYKYDFSTVIQFIAKFDISVYNADTRQTSTSHWLVANQVDSSSLTVRVAAVKQKVFPWVGTAVEMDNPGDGRIFCFLPMPIETASNLPVHVNGTFGLNDDRRTLKWPGVERRSDPMANWNQMLVKEVIPSCYANLLLKYKDYASSNTDFYKAWPSVDSIECTQWEGVLSPVFTAIMHQGVISCQTSWLDEWVSPSAAVFVPQSKHLVGAVENTLLACSVKLAEVPSCVWDAFDYAEVSVTEVNASFLRDKLRACPSSYTDCDEEEKIELLKYCLSDGQFHDLMKLQLLPLANDSFTAFRGHYNSSVYMCTSEFPKWLLPNLDHKLVDVTVDSDLNTALIKVANGDSTQLRLLSMSNIATLLDECMSGFRNRTVISFPNRSFPSDWFKNFWTWVKLNKRQLQTFQNKFVLPIQHAYKVPVADQFDVIKLTASQPVVYIPSHSDCSKTMLSALDKLSIRYCPQTSFPYVHHSQLTSYIKEYSPSALLDVIALKGNYASISFTSKKAECLRTFLYPVINLTQQNKTVIQNLRIFSTCVNSSNGLYSLSQVYQMSLLKQVVVQPATTIDLSVLPANVLVFSSADYYQNQLLRNLGHSVCDGVTFLTQHILPKLNAMGEAYIDPIMTRVLDMYPTLRYSDESITTTLQYLQFVKVASGARMRPCDLYDPSDSCLCDIYKGQGVFPCAPYDSTKHINTLRLCGLQTAVEPQEILDLVYSISLSSSSLPKKVDRIRLLRVRAIMEYISSPSFDTIGTYTVDRSIARRGVPFSDALKLISSHRSWLPVLAERPSDYPAKLPWKGSGYTSHFISLQGSVCVSSSTSSTAALLYGSQAFFTESLNSIESEEPKECLVAHFQTVIASKDVLSVSEMVNIVRNVYISMTRMLQCHTDIQHLRPLRTFKEWIYIKQCTQFVSIDSVAVRQNPRFRHNMEPYLYILPDSISNYFQLFKAFGMNETTSETQIVSVLGRIREEIMLHRCTVSAEEAWSTVMAILNWLTDNGTKEAEHDSVYVPAESDSQWPDLRAPDDLVYTDIDFLKNVVTSSENDEARTYVHNRINQSLAKSLKITALSEELDIAEDTFEDAGQHEPLITRLKNILRDYKDGLTIVKELIQNADDAEATEVNICFDTRRHTSVRNRLFFPDMAESHGPALVIHNNSKFNDEDFINIQKLAGATKQSKHLKIGKFGIGFCSVYHITDVPSFISRDRLYIFDPTLQHLRKAVKNPSQPGKKVNYLTKVIQLSKQLEPYEGLFGFRKNAEYKGTMFRLPFRTSISELSSTCYSTSTVTDLLEDIKKSGDKLLLFLQNVKSITVHRFDANMTSPKILHVVRKPALQRSLSLPLTTASVINLESKVSGKTTNNVWLIATNETTYNGKPAVASVASLLSTSSSSKTTYTVSSNLAGEIFCFLPLSQTTGLPVHVSCNFAVINNRRGIWTSSHEGTVQSDSEVEWNVFLMEKVIPVAYCRLLSALKAMVEAKTIEKYDFYCLWPQLSKLEQKNPWEKCVNSFYISAVLEDLFYSESTSQWLSLRESKFLDPDILGHPSSLTCVLDIISHLKLPLVDLPTPYKSHLKLEYERLTEKEFVELFFANLPQFQAISASRNNVILYMLEAYASKYDYVSDFVGLLESKFKHAFIPTAPKGRVLRRPAEVISPKASFAGLFNESNHRFPLGLLADSHLAMTALEHAGMMHMTLSHDLIIDRAQSVEAMMKRDKVKALERVKLILDILSNGIEDAQTSDTAVTISSIKFLPVVKKPKDYPLPWYGNKYQLLSGNTLVLNSYKSRSDKFTNIAGSQVAFLCEKLPENGGCGFVTNLKTQELLQLRSSPSLHEVILHFKEVIKRFASPNPPKNAWLDITCPKMYQFLEDSIQSDSDLDDLKKMPCIWNGHKFLDVTCVARKWKLNNGPYLYTVPPIISAREKLVLALGIKDKFTSQDAMNSLQMMQSDFGNQPIDDACEELLSEIVTIFHSSSAEELKILKDAVFLPDSNKVLHKASRLVINDAPWAPMGANSVQVNAVLPSDLAIKLGVKPERSKIRENYFSKANRHFKGVPFGQHEELTRRIKNIIRDYPCDITVLKELLQNADDAKASKMYVVLDKRTHGKSSILSSEWGKLQGPALLVWNDSIFTDKDLKGIQELGLGSKRDDAERIGQYGIGFNVVYHVTDCPSFITNGNTLCVLDPHLIYAPEAEALFPGARYDNLKGFWKDFPDMRSAYLQDGIGDLSEECLGGSLFRFPIRHTKEMVEESKIIEQAEPLTAEDLQSKLRKWMPKMKQALFFLNHVTELKYIEIDGKSVKTKFHFKTAIKKPDSFQALQDAISDFTVSSNCRSCVIQYPLTLIELACEPGASTKEERWLIQQGVGDIDNEHQYWHYVKTVRPKHGIAAPLLVPKTHDEHRRDSGKLFCFLPLPDDSNVPVHINGSFVLDSNRRGLWTSTDKEFSDPRHQWNQNLFKAIASSYANFLVQAKEHYIKPAYKDLTPALNDLRNFYHLFPDIPLGDIKKKWTELPCEVYKTLVQSNAEVLCVLVLLDRKGKGKKKPKVSIKWHPITARTKTDQVYFWSSTSGEVRKAIHPVLQSIGMRVTPAPSRKMECLNGVIRALNKASAVKSVEVESESEDDSPVQGSLGSEKIDAYSTIQSVSSRSVFEYYTKYSAFSFSCYTLPQPIEETAFRSTEWFLLFVKFLLDMSLNPVQSNDRSPSKELASSHSSTKYCFPDSPFSHFLLLSAGGVLRKFDETCKVLNSEFSNLFPEHKDKFLHPTLATIAFDSSYFISPEDRENENSQDILLGVFKGTLSPKIHCVKFVTSDVMKKESLLNYWKCFSEDKVFAAFLPQILKQWALLLTIDNRLFSTTNEVLPMYREVSPTCPEADELKHIRAIMQSLQMPFLDCSVVTANVDCPTLLDHDRILSNFYYTAPLSQMKDEHINALITYFSSEAKPSDKEWVEHISSLPFFMDIEGNYSSIFDKKAYIWPKQMCSSGYSKWSSGLDVIFVQSDAKWTSLGSAKQLNIDSVVTAEQVYLEYVFPRFDRLAERERTSHLLHIISLHYSSKNLIQRKTDPALSKEITQAKQFIASLRSLECIGRDSSNLLPISAFCDHTVDVFKVFSSEFQSLPKHFKSEVWLRFFRELGLKTALKKNEFLNLCKKTAVKEETDAAKYCKVLLEYLFSDDIEEVKEWPHDGCFLSQLSNIPFVCAVNTSSVNWIVPGFNQCQLVKLKGAARSDLIKCLWSVRPLFELPVSCIIIHRDEITCLLLQSLGIIYKPNALDVVTNVQNICSGKYSSESLFNNYPSDMAPPTQWLSLIDVMFENFDILNKAANYPEVKSLSKFPCVPVYCDLLDKSDKKMVLVEPSCVITGMSSIDAKKYHPFLHCLPPRLACFSHLLPEIGIKPTLEVHHMQIVLENIYTRSHGEKLDNPNLQSYVKNTLEYLNGQLKLQTDTYGKSVIASSLTPLYLPDTTNSLKKSTTMLYRDTPSFFGQLNLNLNSTCYSLFDVHIRGPYGISATAFCQLLPEEVRPLGLSQTCRQIPDSGCESVEQCELVLELEQRFEDKDNELAIAQAYNSLVPSKVSEDTLQQVIGTFFSSISVITKRKLRMQIVMRESDEVIGYKDSDYYLDSSDSQLILYIDDDLDTYDKIVSEIVEHLYAVISKHTDEISDDIKREFCTFMAQYLKTKTEKQKKKCLAQFNIELKCRYDTSFRAELGKELPECFHHKLDQDPYNIFNPMEYVGYEDEQKHVIIIAQVAHRVAPESTNQLTAIYHIYTSKDDEEGQDVSILDLYKFVPFIKKPAVSSLVSYSEDGEQVSKQSLCEGNLADIKESIKKELKEIWKLKVALRNKAIRRLYLKWHPDKNLNDPERAQEVFQFLQKEIEHLNEGDAGEDGAVPASNYRSSATNRGGFDFQTWNHTARRHREAYFYEEENVEDPQAFDQVKEQRRPEEGERWVKQAEIDYKTLCDIRSRASASNSYCNVCFMAHQVAEKALKGGVYALCGLDGRGLSDHNLTRHAYALETARPEQTQGLHLHSSKLENYYLDTRYPNRWSGHFIPANHYNSEDAEEAKGHAKALLDTVKAVIHT